MSRPEITIHNAITGETAVREMTDQEVAALEAEQSEESLGQADE